MGDFDSAHDRMLAGQEVPIDANTPIAGWYRAKSRRADGNADVFEPVRYQYIGDFGELECFIDGRKVDTQRALDQWPYASASPVTEEAYRNALNGHPWPDVDPTVHAAANGAGSNNPPPGEELPPEAQLLAKVNNALAGLTTYVKWRAGEGEGENNPKTLISAVQDRKLASLIADDEVQARAQSLRDMLLGFKAAAEKAHKVEKAPHLEAGRAIDRKWFDVRDLAEAAANALRSAMSVWETAKFQKQQAAEKVAQDALRKAQDAAEKAGAPLPPLAAPPPPPAAPARIKGGSGKAASVATITQVESVSDWSALAAFLCLQPEVQTALLKVANSMLKADATAKIPGIVSQQVRDVK